MISILSCVLLWVVAEAASVETYNVIDKCWRGDPNWSSNRMKLADCAVGFGAAAKGASGGKIYMVTTEKDDPNNPPVGSLRYGVVSNTNPWIVFARNMNIKLQVPLRLKSYTTVDGRGARVVIGDGGACFAVSNATNVIIHGLTFRNCAPSQGYDGDAIGISSSSHVWVDHNTLSSAEDGLIDINLGSTDVTISNNRFSSHRYVMLLGSGDTDTEDAVIRATIMLNHFGPHLSARMPRVRFGYAHVVNNFYEPWLEYAIGGSSNPTIRSECNVFNGPPNKSRKEVNRDQQRPKGVPSAIRWVSVNDVFNNGAYFTKSTSKFDPDTTLPKYSATQRFTIAAATAVPSLTKDAGALN